MFDNGVKIKWRICLILYLFYGSLEGYNYLKNDLPLNLNLFIKIFTVIALINLILIIPIFSPSENNIAFIHPYCHYGGGGERVLWCIIEHLLMKHSKSEVKLKKTIAIYFSDYQIAQKLANCSSNEDHSNILVTKVEPMIAIQHQNSHNTRHISNLCEDNCNNKFLSSSDASTKYSNSKLKNGFWKSNSDIIFSANNKHNPNFSHKHSSSYFPLFKESVLLKDVKNRFEIDLSKYLPSSPSTSNSVNLYLVPLKTAFLLNPNFYPVCTLLFQGLASIIVSMEALIMFHPSHWIDTTGFPFSCILPKLIGKCITSAYIHYPIIHNQVIEDIKKRKTFVYNKKWISSSYFLTMAKLLYYQLFKFFYQFCCSSIKNKVVNSTWTKTRIDEIWNCNSIRLYPPCDFERFLKQTHKARKNIIVSLSQFRPEKRHYLQLQIFEKLLNDYKHLLPNDLKLYMCGSTRGASDEKIVSKLQSTIDESEILTGHAEIHANLPMEKIAEVLCTSKVALHTMIEEHFGISLLEFIASGLIVVADNSGGPALDILNPLTLPNMPTTQTTNGVYNTSTDNTIGTQIGFLASSFQDYVDMLFTSIVKYDEPYINEMLDFAKSSLKRYENNIQFGKSACLNLGL